MSSLPLVTISVASYNNGKYIIETLDSIYNQSYSNLELVIIDDFSQDNSVEIIDNWLKAYSERFSKIAFIRHEENKGVCKAGNQMLRNANGKYISLIASDDIMMPDKIKVQVDILEKTGEDVAGVYSDAYLINDDSSPRYGWFIQWARPNLIKIPEGDIYNELFQGNFIPAMAMLIKMDCYRDVGFFDEDLVYEDYDMWLRMAKKYKFKFSDYVSVKYRIRNNSLVSTNRTWKASNLKIFSKHLDSNPQALQHIRFIAKAAFLENDKSCISTLKTFEDKIVQRFLFAWNLKLPNRLKHRIANLIY